MAISKERIVQLYRKRARHYDTTANLYHLIGFREQLYRRKAVDALDLHQGDTVVELCCGTGLNFPLLRQAVGAAGTIIGVDLTDSMLEQARKRIQQENWTNVELVHTDVADYSFPGGIRGILTTFAITLAPEYDDIIRRGASALSAGGRFVVLDLKKPDHWPMWLVRAGVLITKPFGVSLDLMIRHPWEAIDRYLVNTSLSELYAGFAYIAVGEAPDPSA